MERLQKIIAKSGVTSRRKAENLITEGKVKVNGEVVLTLGTKVNENDTIEVDGIIISKEDKVYYLLNKPREVIAAVTDDKNRRTVIDLIKDDRRIYPVGRLDYDTTGLIILTNDGDFANLMMHPRNEIDKCYVAKIAGILTPREQMTLKNGVIIDGVKTKRARVKVRKIDKEANTSIVEITIHEGKNHQVRKMFEKVSHEVLKLKREKIAFLSTNGLKSGEYRKLNHKEVATLYSLAKSKGVQ
ncbi:MAG: rRNA pseudouridine synthase [Bacilli bacterium]|nr:rRNA pseudouridine synthase [Bacilli bacterium]